MGWLRIEPDFVCLPWEAGPVGFEPTTFGSLQCGSSGARCPVLAILTPQRSDLDYGPVLWLVLDMIKTSMQVVSGLAEITIDSRVESAHIATLIVWIGQRVNVGPWDHEEPCSGEGFGSSPWLQVWQA